MMSKASCARRPARSSLGRWRLGTAVAGLLTLLLHPAPGAAQATPEERLAAVVQLRAEVPGDARTAGNLGTERRGSGVVIDDQGLVLTIGYLIVEAMTVDVVAPGGGRVPASIVAYDHESGFGLVRALGELGVAPMPLGDSTAVAPREPALVVSNDGGPAVQGVYVVGKREFAGYWEYLLDDAIFTAPPHPRFAGAALVGPDGRLLGIGSLFVRDAVRLPQGVVPGNMFVPIEELRPILGDLLADGRRGDSPRPWLGLTLQEQAAGPVRVVRVAPGGPAARAGLAAGDTITGVAGEPINGLADFYRRIWALGDAGVAVPLDLRRGARTTETVVDSADRYRWLRLDPTY